MGTVIDLTRMLAGPFGAQVLGDLGYDIIKIEQAEIGDATRRNLPRVKGVSNYFCAANRNKRSIVIDFKHPRGKALFFDLVRKADVVFENFRPGVMESLGFGYDALREINPALVMVSINGCGSWGPLRDKVSFDVVAQAMSGAFATTTTGEGEPIKPAIPMADLGAGLFGVIGVLEGLLRRKWTGHGGRYEVSLLDTMLALSSRVGEDFLLNRRGDEPPSRQVPNGIFATGNGAIALSAPTDEAWALLCGVPELASHIARPEFGSAAERAARSGDVEAALGAALRSRSTEEWLPLLSRHGIAATAVRDMRTAFADPRLSAHQMFPFVRHDVLGDLRVIGNPIRREAPGYRSAQLPVPRLGQHSREILRDFLGKPEPEIQELIDQAVVCDLIAEDLDDTKSR